MTCVKTYCPAYIGAPAIQTSRRGRKTSEKIQVDNARKRHFTEKNQLVMLSSRNSVGTPVNGSFDIMWTTVTMDDGALVAIGGGWNLPPSYPNYCATAIEITGTEGSLFLDDSQRDTWLNTVSEGTRFPMSSMPGEQVDHVFAGQMGPETLHFLECVMRDREPMVSPRSARAVMECYLAADL